VVRLRAHRSSRRAKLPRDGALLRRAVERARRYSPAGTPEDIAAALAPYVEAGVRTFHLQPVAGSSEEAAYGVAQ